MKLNKGNIIYHSGSLLFVISSGPKRTRLTHWRREYTKGQMENQKGFSWDTCSLQEDDTILLPDHHDALCSIEAALGAFHLSLSNEGEYSPSDVYIQRHKYRMVKAMVSGEVPASFHERDMASMLSHLSDPSWMQNRSRPHEGGRIMDIAYLTLHSSNEVAKKASFLERCRKTLLAQCPHITSMWVNGHRLDFTLAEPPVEKRHQL